MDLWSFKEEGKSADESMCPWTLIVIGWEIYGVDIKKTELLSNHCTLASLACTLDAAAPPLESCTVRLAASRLLCHRKAPPHFSACLLRASFDALFLSHVVCDWCLRKQDSKDAISPTLILHTPLLVFLVHGYPALFVKNIPQKWISIPTTTFMALTIKACQYSLLLDPSMSLTPSPVWLMVLIEGNTKF